MNDALLQLMERLINGMECTGFYLLNFVDESALAIENSALFLGHANGELLAGQIILAYVTRDNHHEALKSIEEKYRNNIVVICSEEWIEGFYEYAVATDKTYYIKLCGDIFTYNQSMCSNSDFKVLAIIHFYNEEDIIRKTTEYLLNQKIDVYLVDNWSTDSSYIVAQKLSEENPGHVFLEQFPPSGRSEYYDWYHQLQRTEEISKKYDYDWFIHYDADEMRVGPYKGVNLRDTIQYIDSLGYNLIENTVIDFKITDKADDNIFMTDGFFDFGRRAAHFEQVKTWKKSDSVDLKSTGGHRAVVDNPKIFPLKILNRHYPLRSVEQAKKKVFTDRIPRFEKERQERGWHSHYDSFTDDSDFICGPESLIAWDENTINEYYIQFFTGCGIAAEVIDEKSIDLSDIPKGSRIVVYGAGAIGKVLMNALITKCHILHWVDCNYLRMPKMLCQEIESPNVLKEDKSSYDYIIIATAKSQAKDEIMNILLQWGIDRRKILWKTL